MLRASARLFKTVAHCQVGGQSIIVGVSSEIEQYRAETYATKEPETIEWLRQNIKDNDVFYDIGANIGLYSIYAAKLRPACQVYAFEPESQNFSKLCANILLNGLTNVAPCGFPLSDQEAFELFYVYELQPGSAKHSLGASSCWRKDSESVILKQGNLSVTLDALVGKYGLPQPSILKLDVDGLEEKILSAGTVVLTSGKLRSILVEVMFKESDDISWAVEKLTGLGYILKKKSDWVEQLNGLRSQNYIFHRCK